MDVALVIILASFFAMNMGASGFAPSMAAAYGARFLSRLQCVAFFALFVMLGAIMAGGRVVDTISSDILPGGVFDVNVALVVMVTATATLLVANLLKIPQSTSQVTVCSLVGVGIYTGGLSGAPFKLMIPLWFILPFAAYLITLVLGRLAYPRLRHFVLAQNALGRFRI